MQEIARVNDIEMAYCSFGQGPRTLVILPGLSMTSVVAQEEALAAGFALFAEEFTTYVFDRRRNLPETYRIEDMAEDTAAVMEALGLEGVCLFGASQGGMIAQVLAARYPQLVAKLVVGSSASRISPESEVLVRSWLELAQAGDVAALTESTVAHLYSPATVAAYGDAIRASLNAVTPEELANFAILASPNADFNCMEELPKVQAKCLVMGCFGDAVVGPQAAFDTAQALGCALYMYGAEYGHAVYDEAGDYRFNLYQFFMED